MNNYQALLNELTPVSSSLDNIEWREINEKVRSLENAIALARTENRQLRIAVVGQMKAGKSSFLNAAFFGRDLLPKAETPMTAALTKIAYDETAWAEVIFYSQSDWRQIQDKAQEYRIVYQQVEQEMLGTKKGLLTNPFSRIEKPSVHQIQSKIGLDLRASHELVEKVRQQGLNVDLYLGTSQRLEGFGSDISEIATALHDYVGAGGRYTAITKMSALYVNDERLKDLEIYDTPGFNDPVISRGQQTRQFLKQCDIVFLLSTLSQFFANADLQLLRNQLSDAGIDAKAVHVIGTQRDIALRQDMGIAATARRMAERFPPEQRAQATVAAMVKVLDGKMTEQVKMTLASHLQSPDLDEGSRRILTAVHSHQPLFISAWAWMLAEQWPSLSADDREQFEALCRDTGFQFVPDSLRSISNIPKVRDIVLAQRTLKAELLANKERNLLEGVRSGVREHLQRILQGLDRQMQLITTSSVDELKVQKAVITERLQQGRRRLENVFDEKQAEIERNFALLESDIRTVAQHHSRIDDRQKTTQESYRASISKWWNPFSWGNTETRYRDVVTVYTDVQDSIEQLDIFINTTRSKLQELIQQCVNAEQLRHDLAVAAMQLFDVGSADFDPDMLLHEVSRSLRRITIPSTDFGRKNYVYDITSRFDGHIKTDDDQAKQLRQAHRQVIHQVLADLQQSSAVKIQEIVQSLTESQQGFVGRLVADVQENLNGLEQQLVDREQALVKLRASHAVVVRCLTEL